MSFRNVYAGSGNWTWPGLGGRRLDRVQRDYVTYRQYYELLKSFNRRGALMLITTVSFFTVLIILTVILTLFVDIRRPSPDTLTSLPSLTSIAYFRFPGTATLDGTFTPDLTDPNSVAFQRIEREFCSQIDTVMRTSSLSHLYDHCDVEKLRSGSIIVSYALLFVATKENDPDTIHPILTNILQAGQGAITATVELGLVETVTIVINSDDCLSFPCLNNGTCFDLKKGYSCWCPSNYYGQNCENKVDPEVDYCAGSPCNNGGSCYNVTGTYFCACAEGFSGHTCDDDTSLCRNSPCGSNGQCYENNNSYNCECSTGFTGQNCTERVTCEVPVSGVKATLETSNTIYYYLQRANYSCNNSVAAVTQGSLSLLCEADGEWSDSPPVCDTDYCSDSPCGNNGQCYDDEDSYYCECTIGFTGQNCTDIVQCPIPEQGVEATLVTANRTYHVMETANYTCTNNVAVVISGSLSIQCQSNGQWSASPPVCEVQCGDPGNPANATLVRQSGGFKFGQSIVYECNTDHVPCRGDSYIQCNSNGQWSGSPLSCEFVDSWCQPTNWTGPSPVDYYSFHSGNRLDFRDTGTEENMIVEGRVGNAVRARTGGIDRHHWAVTDNSSACMTHIGACANGGTMAFWMRTVNDEPPWFSSKFNLADASLGFMFYVPPDPDALLQLVTQPLFFDTSRHLMEVNSTITLADWTHLTIVYRGLNDTLSLYVNGLEITPVTNIVDTDTDITAESTPPGQFAIGSIFKETHEVESRTDFVMDELLMWDSVLTDDQISQLYNSYRSEMTCF